MIDDFLFTPKSLVSRLMALTLVVIFSLTSTGCLPIGNPRSIQAPLQPEDLPIETASNLEEPEPPGEATGDLEIRPEITLRAASGKTILFFTQDGQMENGDDPQSFEIPHLVLFRDGQLTDPAERSLSINIQELDIPPTGLSATLALETQHKLPPAESGAWRRMRVWSHTLVITNTLGITQVSGASITVNIEFTRTIPSSAEPVLTPTDYYRFELSWRETSQPENGSSTSRDYAFLLESQWIVPLPPVLESAPGAAPDEMAIYACDMFLPWTDQANTPITRLGFHEFLQEELIPQLVAGFQVESEHWGFTWHPEWTSFRADEDSQNLSIALSDGETWYHGPSNTSGNANISLTLVGWIENRYKTMIEDVLSIYFHELFHNLQKAILQHQSGEEETRGKSLAWRFFTEGTATLASSIGQPGLEFNSVLDGRGYLWNANTYLHEPGINLNRSLRQQDPNISDLYWRFLYEHCGGMSQGVEDPAAGMQVIRLVLETLYSVEVVDISTTDDLVAYFPAVMDRALATSACPFHTFAESWEHFAHALYSLHLLDGRCTAPGTPSSCELYDPNGMYREPPVAEITYAGNAIVFRQGDQGPLPGIQGSFGMDFVEIQLTPEAGSQTMTLEFYGTPGSVERFSLQVLPLNDDGSGLPSIQVSDLPVFSGEWASAASPKPLAFTFPILEPQSSNRLGVIITRLDNQEVDDPVGAYTIILHP